MVGKPLNIFWTPVALGDLDRFADFLRERNPPLAASIAEAISSAADVLADLPLMGRQMAGKPFRQLFAPVANASYVLRYRVEGQRVVILRVFHGREQRS